MQDQQTSTRHPLLDAAQTAIREGDPERAGARYLEYFDRHRDDPVGLAEYGSFCLRTGHAHAAAYLLTKAATQLPRDVGLMTTLGYAHVELKDFAAARNAFATSVELSPDHAPAQYGLGLCHEDAGEWPAAAAAFGQSLNGSTEPLPILLRLAEACNRAGDTLQARAHFAQAQRDAPDNPALLLAFARFLREHGEPAQAMVLINRGGKRHPDEARFILEKARCLRALGEIAHALRWLERLAQRAPAPEVFAEIGHCLAAADDRAQCELFWLRAIDGWIGAGDFTHAETLLVSLLAAHPRSVDGWTLRGKLESTRQRFDAADAAWRQALECDPTRVDVAASLALLYENTNRLAEAKTVADNALRHVGQLHARDGQVELLIALSKVARRQKDHARSLQLLDQIDALAATDAQRRSAAFERGKLFDQHNDAAAAIAAFTTGNAIAHEPWLRANPGRNRALAGIELMLQLIGNGWLQQWKPVDDPADPPDIAFLIGFPRSGTTLLNQVLDSHDAIQALEEKPLVAKVMDVLREMPKGYPHALAELDAFDTGYLREAYLRAAAEHGASDHSRLLLDKFPMQTNLVGLLWRLFPQAKFIFALRHPCDVVLSCFMQSFTLNNTMANFCTLADAVALYTRTMDLWQLYREQLPLSVHTVRYEDVVDDFDGQTQALCDFLGVPWKTELRDFSARAIERGLINTPSYEQVSRPIYREARYRWERYREWLAPFLPDLQPYTERFGYSS